MLRWLNCLRRRHEPAPSCITLERKVTPGQKDATAALKRAREATQTALELGRQGAAEAASLRELRERNHFAEAFYHLFEGGRS